MITNQPKSPFHDGKVRKDKSMKRYTVRFGGKSVIVQMDENTIVHTVYGDDGHVMWEETAEEYDGGNHNFSGLRGAVIDKAVTKLFGKNCFWFGNYDDKSYGQVFEALHPSKYDSNPGNSSITSCLVLKCTYQEKGETRVFF
jgi:hypothetical protein